MNLGEPPGVANPGDYISAVTVGVVPKGANQQYIVLHFYWEFLIFSGKLQFFDSALSAPAVWSAPYSKSIIGLVDGHRSGCEVRRNYCVGKNTQHAAQVGNI